MTPGASAAAGARRQHLRDVLLDLLRTASAASGRVPNLQRLLCRHPNLADELRTLFAAVAPEPEPRS